MCGWSPLACGVGCTAALLLIAVPVLNRAQPDNPTVLDRNCPLGLAVALAPIWVLVVAATAAGHARHGTSPRPDPSRISLSRAQRAAARVTTMFS